MSNVYLHPAAAGCPGAVQFIEAQTGLTAVPAGAVVVLERKVISLRERARDLLRPHRRRPRGDDDPSPTPPSAA